MSLGGYLGYLPGVQLRVLRGSVRGEQGKEFAVSFLNVIQGGGGAGGGYVPKSVGHKSKCIIGPWIKW